MHTACVDQHWSSSGVSEVANETVVLPSVNSIFGLCPCLCGHVSVTYIIILCIKVYVFTYLPYGDGQFHLLCRVYLWWMSAKLVLFCFIHMRYVCCYLEFNSCNIRILFYKYQYMRHSCIVCFYWFHICGIFLMYLVAFSLFLLYCTPSLLNPSLMQMFIQVSEPGSGLDCKVDGSSPLPCFWVKVSILGNQKETDLWYS
jgi:hypothetical protein